jgi:hypothetical protein
MSGATNGNEERNFFGSEKMKSRHFRLIKAALVMSLAAGSMPALSGAANADPNTLKAQAPAELVAVTDDIDKANIMFSPADDGVGANFAKVTQYQQEYMAGRQSFDDGKYADALQHLRKADKIIHSQPDWTQSE